MCLGGACEFALLCSFAGGVEPFLPPLEELVVCEICVCDWFHEFVVKLLLLCLAFLLCFLAFGITYVT
jgi:hypothetical protein